eukprot:3045256-Pyramimonas_sp.AAC.2
MATVWLRMAAEWLVSMATVQACMAVQSSMDDVLHLVDEEQNYLKSPSTIEYKVSACEAKRTRTHYIITTVFVYTARGYTIRKHIYARYALALSWAGGVRTIVKNKIKCLEQINRAYSRDIHDDADA